jgi:hypothetical protein
MQKLLQLKVYKVDGKMAQLENYKKGDLVHILGNKCELIAARPVKEITPGGLVNVDGVYFTQDGARANMRPDKDQGYYCKPKLGIGYSMHKGRKLLLSGVAENIQPAEERIVQDKRKVVLKKGESISIEGLNTLVSETNNATNHQLVLNPFSLLELTFDQLESIEEYEQRVVFNTSFDRLLLARNMSKLVDQKMELQRQVEDLESQINEHVSMLAE